MTDTQAFSVDVPRERTRIDIVEFAGNTIRSTGLLVSVSGPYRIGPHDNYLCKSIRGEHFHIFRIQAGEKMDWEVKGIYYLLTGIWPETSSPN